MSAPTVVLVSYGAPHLLARCLQSLRRHAPQLAVSVWDNRSEETPAVKALAQAWPEVSWTFHPENIGFAAAVNGVAEQTSGDLLLLNPDAELLAGLGPLFDVLERHPRVAAVGPQVIVTGLREWDNARRLPGPVRMTVEYWGLSNQLRGTPLSQRYRKPPHRAGYVSGACLLIRRQAWEDVGPFDERFWLYSEEVDWARRARRRGWQILLLRQTLASHVGGASSAVTDDALDRVPSTNWLLDMQLAYLAKHHGRLAAASYRLAAAGYRCARSLRRRRRG